MKPLATIRKRPRRSARHGFAGFVVVWLNFALQPCAMAFEESNDHECPHCPPAHTSDHGDHAMPGHSPASSESPCATSSIDCSLIDDFRYDGRNTELKLKNAPSDVPVAVHPGIGPIPQPRSIAEVRWHPTRSPPPGKQTPLNVLYCVYLD